MTEDIGNLAIKLSLDSANFTQSMSSIDRNLKAMGQEMRAAQNHGNAWGNSVTGLTTKQEGLTRMLDGQGIKVNRLREQYERSKAETGANSAATERLAIQLNRATAEYSRTEAELAQVAAALRRQRDELRLSESSWTQLGERMRAFGATMTTVGDKMTSVGKNMSMKITAPLMAIGTLAAKVSIDFESSMAGVRKTVDMTDAEFGTLTSSIREMSKALPASATEIAGVAEAAGQLGIKNDAILGFTRTMVDLGVATNMSATEAATALARFQNVTNMSQQDFDRLGSTVVALGNNFATTESEIVEMAMRLAGAGAQVGMSEADIMGLSAALSSVGIRAEMGGSAISRVMSSMQVATSSGFTKVQKLSKDTGLSLRDLQMMASHSGKAFGNMAKDMGMTKKELTAIVKAGVDLKGFSDIAGMTAEQFKKAFGDDAAGAIASFIEGLGTAEQKGESAINMLQEMGITEILLRDSLLRSGGAYELVASSIDMANEAWEENNALTKEAEERYKTTESQMKIMGNYLKDLGITLGAIILPVINSLIEKLKPLIEKFANMSEATQKTILVIAGLVAAIGPVLVVTGVLVSSLGSIFTALGTASAAIAVMTTGVASAVPAVSALAGVFTVLTGPIGIAIAAIAGIGIGVGLLVKHLSKDAIPEVDRFGKSVSESTQKALGGFFELSDGVSQSMAQILLTSSKVTGEMKNEIVGKYAEMNTQILEGKATRHTEELAQMNSMFLNTSVLTDKEKEEILNKKQSQYASEVEILEAKRKSINDILQLAANENRELTEREKNVINNINEQAKEEAVKVLSASEMEQKVILERMKDSAVDLSAQQAAEVVKNSAEQRNKSVAEAEGQFDETYAAILRMRDETGELTAEQATKMIAEAKKSRDVSVKYAENMHEDVVKEAKEQAEGHVEHVNWETGEILSKWGVFKNKTKTTFSEIASGIKDGWDKAWMWTKEKTESIKKFASEKFEEMKTSVKKKMEESDEKIKEIWRRTEKFFSEIDLKQVGKDIIKGLINGIGSMAKDVWDKAKEIAKSIGDAIKDTLQIKSPSRVMEGLGKNTGEGLMKGLDGTKAGILESMNDIVEGITSLASPRIKSSKKTKVAAMILTGILNRSKYDGRLIFSL